LHGECAVFERQVTEAHPLLLRVFGLEEVLMAIPAQVKPAVWGAIAGAIAAIIIGFVWGGWVTGGTSATNAGVAAQTAVVQAFVPLCVAKAEQQPDQLPLMKKESAYSQYDFVVKAGWVSNVAEKYRRDVATACAAALVEAMDATAAKKTQ
jgi:hypothetical protein